MIRHLRRAVLRHDAAGRTDGRLLASFIEQKDEAAFGALVRRHGRMVFGVCRRVLRNHHDAEDAFQVTFLVLARKASSVKPRDKVANWLHGVALRTALKAKAMTAKRRRREKQVAGMPEPKPARQDQGRDLQPLLDQELNGLPENYRLPILICDLGGKTIKEAARQLGWPQGTLASRLARGRKLLAKRLVNRGVVFSAGPLAAVVLQDVASAGVPTSLLSSTVKAVTVIAAGQATIAGAVPARVAALTEGVMKSMLLTKLRIHATTLGAVLVILSLGGGLVSHRRAAAQPSRPVAATIDQRPGPSVGENSGDDRFRGTWKVISITALGRQAAPKNLVWKFEDGKLVMSQALIGDRREGQDGQEATYRLGGDPNDAEPTSTAIDMKVVLTTSPPGEKPVREGIKTFKGIYAWDGNRLVLCFALKGDQRPTQIPDALGRDVAVFVLVKE
jgi:RNA polymerase sigma factor (sigma-70 family)